MRNLEQKAQLAKSLLESDSWQLAADWIDEEKERLTGMLVTGQAGTRENYWECVGRIASLDLLIEYLTRLIDQYEKRIASENRASEPES